MLTWMAIVIIIYLLIGINLFIYGVMADPWCGLMLEFAIPFVLFYPYFIFRSLFNK